MYVLMYNACMCLRIMHVCVVFSNFEITGIYRNWYSARNEKLKNTKGNMYVFPPTAITF